jgi:hypothetical protein
MSVDTVVRYIVVYKGLYGVIILTVIKGGGSDRLQVRLLKE